MVCCWRCWWPAANRRKAAQPMRPRSSWPPAWPIIRLAPFAQADWLPRFCTRKIWQVNAGQWFAAKQSREAARPAARHAAAGRFGLSRRPVGAGVLRWAMAAKHLQTAFQPLKEVALPLMQVWQQALAQRPNLICQPASACHAAGRAHRGQPWRCKAHGAGRLPPRHPRHPPANGAAW